MALHGLTAITIGVPNLAETAAYYADFGLQSVGEGRFASGDGGEQLRLVATPRRRLLEMRVGVDYPDDLDRAASALARLDLTAERGASTLSVSDPGTDVRVVLEVAPRVAQQSAPAAASNGPGRAERLNARAAAIDRDAAVRPRKLGHVVVGSRDAQASQRFFTEGIGFKVSDLVKGRAAFLRCSTDHHNLLLQQAPVTFLHHTSWQVDDVDEVGRGAQRMLAQDPARHVWGLGRHYIGSNFFWYLRDPAGNFTEYYSDMDCILDDQLWQPGVFEGARSLFAWGPPPPPSFLAPEDLAGLMTGAHSAR